MADVANYVKFNRGSLAAYNAAIKNSDTLYFIHNEDNTKYSIYLGDKPVANGVSSFAEIEDILLNELGDKQLLVYDATEEKWVNKSVKEAISEFKGASADTQGQSGLVPAPGIGDQNKFLRGDGTWAAVESGSTTRVYEATPVDEESHVDALTRVVNGTSLNVGDIGVVKTLIAADKYEYTAYVYNGTDWAAMDGNYSADNVYFNSDFVFTEKVGTVQTLTNGSATVKAEGKSVKEFFTGLFAKENTDINVSKPSVSITLNSAGAKEVGSKITPSYSVSFNKGSYQYGPDTGITAEYEVTNSVNSEEKSTSATGSFSEITVGDDTTYSVSVKATYTEGAVPKSNLGNLLENKKISAGTVSNISSGEYTGYRNTFYGVLNDKSTEITSDVLRSLNKSNAAYSNGSTFTINVKTDALRAVFAYPATLRDVNSVLDVNGMNAQIKSSFSMTTVDVEGANGYEAIPYKVYVIPFADPITTANTYKVTI